MVLSSLNKIRYIKNPGWNVAVEVTVASEVTMNSRLSTRNFFHVMSNKNKKCCIENPGWNVVIEAAVLSQVTMNATLSTRKVSHETSVSQ